jgi:hypothetical protein
MTITEKVNDALLFAYRQLLTAGLLDDAARTRRVILALNHESEED